MAYPAIAASYVTASTLEAADMNANFAAIVTGVSSGLCDINVATCQASGISFDSSVKFGNSNMVNFYYYSHTITAGDIAAGYARVDIGSFPVSYIAAAIPTPIHSYLAGYARVLFPYTNAVRVDTGSCRVYVTDNGFEQSVPSCNVEGNTFGLCVIVRA